MNGNILDCIGECSGTAIIDECGVCGGSDPVNGMCDDDCILGFDCLGECGGTAIIDECGVCNGENISCTGCMIEGADNYSSVYTIPDNEICFISYNSNIQPIFDNNCIGCHGSSGGLDLSSYNGLLSGGDHGPSIIPNQSENSILIEKLTPNPSFGDQMNYLSQIQINKILLWIDLGAGND